MYNALKNVPIDQIYNGLRDISIGSVLVPLVFCILKGKALNPTFRALFIYLILAFLIEIFILVLAGKFQNGYVPFNKIFTLSDLQLRTLKDVFAGKYRPFLFALANAFTLIQFLVFTYIYYIQFTQVKMRGIIKIITILYLVFSAIVFYFKKITEPDNLTTVVEGCIMWTLAIYYFYKVLNEMSIPELANDSFIWLNSAIVIYFSVALVLFLADDYLETCSKRIFQALWSLHLIAHITFNSLSAVGVWKQENTV